MENKNNFWKNKRLLPAITTIGSKWREKIAEVKKLKLEEICFFLTCLDGKERKEFYKLVKETKIKEVPLVHLRSDMELWELDYLVENYGTQVFNIHSHAEFPLVHDYSKYKDIIYIENTRQSYNEEEIKNFGGICLDLSHLENNRISAKEKFEHNTKIIKRYPVGCNHISAIKKIAYADELGVIHYDNHFLEDFSELDYLKKYPSFYFSSFIVIELENSITKQLEAKNYIIHLLKDK